MHMHDDALEDLKYSTSQGASKMHVLATNTAGNQQLQLRPCMVLLQQCCVESQQQRKKLCRGPIWASYITESSAAVNGYPQLRADNDCVVLGILLRLQA